jgi:putative membrane protein
LNQKTPTLESDVRAADVLANERTYLAYLRTALAFVGFGFVIARFSLFTREISLAAHMNIPTTGSSKDFGVAMVVAGALVAVVGAARYTTADRALRENRVSALSPAFSFGGALLIAAVGAIVAIDLFRVSF